MTTLSSPRRSTKSTRPFSCSIITLTIEINDHRYSVDQIPAGEFGTRAFRLVKRSADRETYDVIRGHDGNVACDCPDFVFRHDSIDAAPCKHIRALVELGLMPAPIAPTVTNGITSNDTLAPTPSVGVTPMVEVPAPSMVMITTDAVPAPAVEGTHQVSIPAPAPSVEIISTPPAPCCSPVEPAPAPYEPTADDLTDMQEAHQFFEAKGHLDHSDRLTLAELVDRQVEFFSGWGNAAGRMLANAMTELALKVRMVDATTPDEYDARITILDDDVRNAWMDAGRAECQGEPEMTSAGRYA